MKTSAGAKRWSLRQTEKTEQQKNSLSFFRNRSTITGQGLRYDDKKTQNKQTDPSLGRVAPKTDSCLLGSPEGAEQLFRDRVFYPAFLHLQQLRLLCAERTGKVSEMPGDHGCGTGQTINREPAQQVFFWERKSELIIEDSSET